MSKRHADTYLTKEPSRNRPDDDFENERDKVDPVQIASEEVMATRKVAKPRRSRFANAGGATEQNNGTNGGPATTQPPASSSGGIFGSIKAPSFSSQLPSFSFGSTASSGSNPFAKITAPSSSSNTFTISSSTDQKPSNPFASIKPITESKSLFPPNSPFAKHPPAAAATPSGFTREMAAQQPTTFQSQLSRGTGPMRTPRHSMHEPAPQSFQTPHQPPRSFQNTSELNSTFKATPQAPPTVTSRETPAQRAIVRSNGDNVPIATPDRNPSDPPEKHYWQRIKAMNEAFHEAVGRSIEGDGYCNLEWLFGQYKYWREEIERGYPYNPAVDSPAPTQAIAAKSSSRLEDLKAGIIMKPPTPSRSALESSSFSGDTFERSQAPPPESQRNQPWDDGSTQSTERTRSFGLSQETPRGSKTADTILGVLESPATNATTDVKGEYKHTMDFVKKRQEREGTKDTGMFGVSSPKPTTKPVSSFSFSQGSAQKSGFGGSSFGNVTKPKTTMDFLAGGKSETPASFGRQNGPSKPETSFSGGKSMFGSSFGSTSSTTPVTSSFGKGSSFATAKPSALGQGSSFPTVTSSKSFGKAKGASSSTTFSPQKSDVKAVPSRQPPEPVVVEPPAPNRFSALSAPSPEKEVITIDSDDDMIDEKPQSDEDMEDEQSEVEEGEEEEMVEEEEEEEEDEAMGDENGEDDIKDADYVVIEGEDQEEEEEEPVEEEVAKEVEELVEASPERKEKEAPKPEPFKFGQSITATSFNMPFTFGSSNLSQSATDDSSKSSQHVASRMDEQVPQIKPFSFEKQTEESRPEQPKMDDQVPVIQPSASENTEQDQPKDPEMSEINPDLSSAPKPFTWPSSAFLPQHPTDDVAPTEPEPKTETKSTFRFGLPTTPSTFKGEIPQLGRTPASALRKEFKFGLPGEPIEKKAEAEVQPPEAPEVTPKERPRSPRYLRSSSPSKRAAHEPPQSPSKRQRAASPQKKLPEKEVPTEAASQSSETTEMQDTIEVKEPPKPFVFGANSSLMNPPTADNKELPKTFAFGAATTSDSSNDIPVTPKPFTFGGSTIKQKDFTWTPDKPIKFDTPPSTNTQPASTTFTFGQSSGAQPFKFGGLMTPIPAPPKFGTSPSAFNAFGGQSISFTPPSLGFSFGQAKSDTTETKSDTQEETQTETQATDDNAEEDAPPVSEDIGAAGEEDENTVFSERAKLILRLSAAERAKEVEKRVKAGGKEEDVKMDRDYGIGVVRVNVHKETKKGRILFRLEGSGRVVLNSYLVSGVDYLTQGKSMVLVPAPRSDGTGFDSYFVRLKDGALAETLAKTLQEKKHVA